MRKPQESIRHESVVCTRTDHTQADEPFAIEPRHQMLFGQLALIALLCLAILLRSLA